MDTTDAIKMNPSEKLKQFAISELELVERCKNSTLEAMVMFPNVAEYIVQVEKERDELRTAISELQHNAWQATNKIEHLRAIISGIHYIKNQLENALVVVLPMAKGYAFEHDVGNNKAMVREAEETLAKAQQELQP